MSDTMTFALNLTFAGLVVVFVSLTLISLAISFMRWLDAKATPYKAPQVKDSVEDQNIDNLTLVLISAAAATMINGRFRIKTVRRMVTRASSHSGWSNQGRSVLMGSHSVNIKR